MTKNDDMAEDVKERYLEIFTAKDLCEICTKEMIKLSKRKGRRDDKDEHDTTRDSKGIQGGKG